MNVNSGFQTSFDYVIMNISESVMKYYERIRRKVMDQIKRRDMELPYISDDAVFEQQKRARKLTQELNMVVDRSDFESIARIVKELFGKSEGAFLNPPFYCDYGFNIEVGKNFFANYNCTILDVAKVVIGDNCQMAPNVAIYTAGHPVHPDTRNTAYEYGIGVTIGDNVWIGGNTVICPGVHIGSNTVIGAGSVVTKDIPDWVIAAGNPCRVIRSITEADRKLYYKDREFDEEAWADIQSRGLDH
jgi:maltose O-acetyltransferase